MIEKIKEWVRQILHGPTPSNTLIFNLEDERLRRKLNAYIDRRRAGQ